MAAGRRAFHGDSTASLIAAILTTEPERVSAARAAARIAGRCRSPWITSSRGPSAGARTIGGRRPATSPANCSGRPARRRTAVPVARLESRRRWWRAAAITLAVVTLAALLGRVPVGSPSIRREPTRFTIAPPPGTSIGLSQNRTRFALSPDGRHVVFVGWTEDVRTCGSGRCRRSSRSVSTAPRAPRRRSGRPTAGLSATSLTPPASCGRSWRRGGRRRPSAPRRATAARRGGATAPFSSRSFAMDSTACRRPGAARCA